MSYEECIAVEAKEQPVCEPSDARYGARRRLDMCSVDEQQSILATESERRYEESQSDLPACEISVPPADRHSEPVMCVDTDEAPSMCGSEPGAFQDDVVSESSAPPSEWVDSSEAEETLCEASGIPERSNITGEFSADVAPVCEDSPASGPDLPVLCDVDPSSEESPQAQEVDSIRNTHITRTAPSEPADVRRIFENNFERLDADGDNFISESEVAEAMVDRSFTGEDARLVAMLHEHQDQLEELHDDEFGDENDGITREDISAFDDLQRIQQAGVAATAYGYAYFTALDADGDGHVTTDELQTRLADSSLKPEEEALLARLRSTVSEIEESSNDEFGDENDGFTLVDVERYTAGLFESDEGLLVQDVESTMDYHQARLEECSNGDLYANSEDPLSSIVPEAIRQGIVGDCYFMSAVSSFAASDPEAIRDMIQHNEDGTFTVTFPGAPDEPITVAAPTEQELGLYAGGTEHGIWPAVLERAYGEYCNRSILRRSPLNPDGGDTAAEAADGGGLLRSGLDILSATGVNQDIVALQSEDDLHRTLTAAFAEGRPVTAGIAQDFDGTTDAGLYTGHAYSITGYDPTTRTVTVRNPWGEEGNYRGEFEMSLEDFQRNFDLMACAE